MTDNPYQSPRSQANSTGFRLPGGKALRRFPATIIGLILATFIGTATAAKEYHTQVRMEQEGSVLVSGSPFDYLAFPGILFLYVVGTLTNSFVCAWIAFAKGMALAYGISGLMLDALLWLIVFRPD